VLAVSSAIGLIEFALLRSHPVPRAQKRDASRQRTESRELLQLWAV